jgi:hypothetical protein
MQAPAPVPLFPFLQDKIPLVQPGRKAAREPPGPGWAGIPTRVGRCQPQTLAPVPGIRFEVVIW